MRHFIFLALVDEYCLHLESLKILGILWFHGYHGSSIDGSWQHLGIGSQIFQVVDLNEVTIEVWETTSNCRDIMVINCSVFALHTRFHTWWVGRRILFHVGGEVPWIEELQVHLGSSPDLPFPARPFKGLSLGFPPMSTLLPIDYLQQPKASIVYLFVLNRIYWTASRDRNSSLGWSLFRVDCRL